MDQEAAMDEDEASFDPDLAVRDYQAVADDLPVFCVSARAYQKLSGRLIKDTVLIEGFPQVADTEVPALQDHVRKLTEAGRTHSSRRFLNDLAQLVNSMHFWAATDQDTLRDDAQQANEVFIRERLDVLKTVSDRANVAWQALSQPVAWVNHLPASRCCRAGLRHWLRTGFFRRALRVLGPMHPEGIFARSRQGYVSILVF